MCSRHVNVAPPLYVNVVNVEVITFSILYHIVVLEVDKIRLEQIYFNGIIKCLSDNLLINDVK